MAYPALDIARHTLTYCTSKSHPISNLKLQKILYFLWIDYYKETRMALYEDDICAWQLGPVVPDVYYEYCSYAGKPIVAQDYPRIEVIDTSILNRLIDKYILISASTLVNRTHQPNKPWSVVYQDGIGIRDVIPFSLITRLECNC